MIFYPFGFTTFPSKGKDFQIKKVITQFLLQKHAIECSPLLRGDADKQRGKIELLQVIS